MKREVDKDEIKEFKDFQNRVSDIISDKDCHLQLYLVLQAEKVKSKLGKEFQIKLANLEEDNEHSQKSAMLKLKELFHNSLDNSIVKNKITKTLRGLKKDEEVIDAFYYYDYNDYPNELGVLHKFNINDAVNYEIFNFKEDGLDRLFGFFIYFGTMNDGLVLFKKHYPISLIKQGASCIFGIKDNERMQLLDNINILRFNEEWQMMNLDGKIYIQDLKILNQNPGFTKLIERAAKKNIDHIKKLNIIENVEVFEKEMEDVSFVRKLSKIQDSSLVFSPNIKPEDIINFSQNSNLQGQFNLNKSKDKIILKTKKQRVAFISLLNDDFLHSELTQGYYRSHSKDSIKVQ